MPKNTRRKNTNRARTTTRSKGREQSFAIQTSSEDPLNVQIAATVKLPKGRKISKEVIRQAIIYKLNSTELKNPRGFKLRIVTWTNPTRNPEKINPRNGLPLNAPRDYGPDRERWETLRRPLLSSGMVVKPLGGS